MNTRYVLQVNTVRAVTATAAKTLGCARTAGHRRVCTRGPFYGVLELGKPIHGDRNQMGGGPVCGRLGGSPDQGHEETLRGQGHAVSCSGW